MKKNIIFLIKDNFYYFTRYRKLQLLILFVLVTFVSLLELAGIGSVLPFVSVFIDKEILINSSFYKYIYSVGLVEDDSNIILTITIAFIFLNALTTFLKILQLWFLNKISFSIGTEVGAEVLCNILNQRYEFHQQTNSSELIDLITNRINGYINTIILTLTLLNSLVLFLAITAAIMYINYKIASILIFGLCFVYLIILFVSKEVVKSNGVLITQTSTLIIQIIQESLQGIKNIIIDNTHQSIILKFKNADNSLRRAQLVNNFISQSPRNLIEFIAITLICYSLYVLSQSASTTEITIPTIAAIAYGLQKLLPIIQNIYSSWTSIKGNQKLVEDVLAGLRLTKINSNQKENDEILSNIPIKFDKICFKYSDVEKNTLENITFQINPGESIGIIGKTGSGKSTLLNIILGLLSPSSGTALQNGKRLLLCDNKNWYKRISHVPQSIFLNDSTILENIAHGQDINDIDTERVSMSIRFSCLEEYIAGLPEKLNNIVGENGIQISGGQKQRLGIARALYKEFEILVMDEATSALDNETELKIMSAIIKEFPFVAKVIVAHRLSTLSSCDKILELDNGKLVKIWSNKEFKTHFQV